MLHGSVGGLIACRGSTECSLSRCSTARSGQLFLARDRFGVKPLFMAQLSDGSIAFASELKGLLVHPLLRRRVNPQAIEAYMTWGYVPDTHSILAGVEKLAAGHFWGCSSKAARRGDRSAGGTSTSRGREARKRGRSFGTTGPSLTRRGWRSRMVADVPLGAFLSGGVDSSGVVALMSEASSQPVQTCSIGFDVAAYDETSHAPSGRREVRRGSSGAHFVAADDFSAIDQLAAMFDEPFADASALPTWRVCQLARERVTVALSGDGADEAFAGYRRQVFQGPPHHEERARRCAACGLAWCAVSALWAVHGPRPIGPRARCGRRRPCGAGGERRGRFMRAGFRSPCPRPAGRFIPMPSSRALRAFAVRTS